MGRIQLVCGAGTGVSCAGDGGVITDLTLTVLTVAIALAALVALVVLVLLLVTPRVTLAATTYSLPSLTYDHQDRPL